MKYSIVVPCYNEEKNIENLVSHFKTVNEKLKSEGFELILVNNGSKDNSQKVIDKVISENDFIKCEKVEENKGYGYGILSGMKVCTGEYIGWIHADLQFMPEKFLDFIEVLDSPKVHDRTKIYMKGLRRNRPFLDTLFTIGMSFFESLFLGMKLWDINAQPTLMHRSNFDTSLNAPFDFSLDMFFYCMAKKNQFQIIRLPSQQHARTEGESSWNTGMSARIKLIKRTLSYSTKLKKILK